MTPFLLSHEKKEETLIRNTPISAPGVSRAIISREKISQIEGEEDAKDETNFNYTSKNKSTRTAKEHERTGKAVVFMKGRLIMDINQRK